MSLLETINLNWHAELAASYNRFLAALTALAHAEASTHWEDFKRSLHSHLDFEDEHIAPLCESLDSGSPGNTHTLLQADHTILTRLMGRIDTALAELKSAQAPRATLVEQLDGYLKLRNVLTHHDLRETEQIYPALVAQLGDRQHEALGKAMQAQYELQTTA